MSKVVKAVVGIAAITGIALTGGAALFAGASLAGAGTWLTGTVAGRLLTSVALSALSQALNRPKAQEHPGIRTGNTTRGDVTPDGFVLGRYATAGTFVAPPYTHGRSGHKTPNAYLQYVIHLGSAPGQKLAGLLIDGKPCRIGDEHGEIPWDGNTNFGGSKDWHGKLREYGKAVFIGDSTDAWAWVRFVDGTQTTVDGRLRNRYRNHPHCPWTDDMVGTGICYAVMTFQFNDTLYKSFPSVRFVLDGIPLYDPRLDSSVGGNGPQRWGQPATYASSENTAVQIYNLKRGIALPGGHVYGGGATAAQLPLSSWFAAMNACDARVERADGQFEPAWRTSFEINVSEPPAAAIEELCASTSIQLAEMGGVWTIRVGAPGVPVAWITDDDVLITKDRSTELFSGFGKTHNGASVSFPVPESGWQPAEGPIYMRSDYVAADRGRELVANLSLPAAPYPQQNQRLIRAFVEEERRERRFVVALPSAYDGLEALDTITWSSSRHGFADKLFEVTQAVTDPLTQVITASLRERDPSDWAWDKSYALPWSPVAPAIPLPVEVEVGLFSASAFVALDGSGKARRPAILLEWDADEVEGLDGIEWELRLAGGTTAKQRGSITDIAAGELTLVEGILPAEDYEVRARPVGSSFNTIWTDWFSVTTPDIRLGFDDMSDDVRVDVDAALDALGDARVAATDAKARADDAKAYRDETEVARLAADTAADAAALAAGTSIENRDGALDYKIAAEAAAGAADASARAAQLAKGGVDDALTQTNASKAAAEAAGTAAQKARNEAQTFAATADGAATSAVGHADTAKSSADSAGQSATSAAASLTELNARLAQAALIPSDMTDQGANWTSGISGAPSAAVALATPPYNFGTDAEFGEYVRVIPANQGVNRHILSREVIPYVRNRTYTFTVRVRALAVLDANKLRFYISVLDASYNQIDVVTASVAVTAANQWQVRTFEWTVPETAGRAYLRMGVMIAGTDPDNTVDVNLIGIDDTTAATAAASHAITAAVSATAAEVAAAASEQSRLSSETARGQAQVARNDAVSAKENAEGAATTASQQANIATGAKNAANDSATAAAGSASTAESRATAADTSARAAEAARVAANTARSGAEVARDGAASAKEDAAGSAAAAQQSSNLSVSAARQSELDAAAALPATFEGAGKYWTSSQNGKAETTGPLAPVIVYGTDPAQGDYIIIPADTAVQVPVLTKAVVPYVEGRTWRLTAVVRVRGSGAVAADLLRFRASLMRGDQSYGAYSTPAGSIPVTSSGPGWRSYSFDWKLRASSYAQFIRFGLLYDGAKETKSAEIVSLRIEDVTAQLTAEAGAAAASGSAQVATAKATEAEQSASASAADRLSAQTARTQTEAFLNQTVAARDTATGAASTATQQAGVVTSLTGQGAGVLKDQFFGTGAGFANFVTAPAWMANAVYPVGRTARFNLSATTRGGLSIRSDAAAWSGAANAAAYVVEVEFTLVSGSIDGSGVMIDWINTSSGWHRASKSLASMLRAPVRLGHVLVASGVFVKPSSYGGTFSHNMLYLMANHEAFTQSAGDIRFHRITVRPATAEELGGGEVAASMQAYVNRAIETFVDNEFGTLAQEVSQLGASMGGLSATVEQQSSALVGINGDMSALLGFRVKAGSQNAVLELVAADDAKGGPASTSIARIAASVIDLDGAVYARHLTVGEGANLLANSDLTQGPTHYSARASSGQSANFTFDLRPPSPSGNYAGRTYPTLYLQYDGTAQNVWGDILMVPEDRDGTPQQGYAVEGNGWCELSAQMSLHRAHAARLMVTWYDAAGASLGTVTVASLPEHEPSSGTNPEVWPRYGALVKAPATAAFAEPFVRLSGRYSGTGANSAFVFLHKPFLGKTKAGAELSPWSNGGQTVVDGGTIRARSVDLETATTGRLNARHLQVTEFLRMEEQAALGHGKESLSDPADGIFFGRSIMGNGQSSFGLSLSRTRDAKRQSVDLTEGRFRILNANHAVTAAAPPSVLNYAVTRPKSPLPVGTRQVTLRGVGGGASGIYGAVGNPGTASVVRLYDGNTLKHTITMPGGAIGTPNRLSGSGKSEARGKSSYYAGDVGAGQPAAGYGAGGGGGLNSLFRAYDGGNRAVLVTSEEFDLGGWADPQIQISVGSGGASVEPSGDTRDSSRASGSGGGGFVEVIYNTNVDIPADVVPLIPTAHGTFQKPSGTSTPQSFPNLGAGLWVLHNGNGDLGLDEITISPGVTTWAGVAKNITFVSSMTPTYKPGGSAQTIRYAFYSMGSWG